MTKPNFESDVKADPYKIVDELLAGHYPESQISTYHIDRLVTALTEQVSLSDANYPKSAKYLDRLASYPSLSLQERNMIQGARNRIRKENPDLEQQLNTPEPGPEP